MENCPRRFSAIGNYLPNPLLIQKSRFCQAGDFPSPGTAVICPEPRRAIGVACVIDKLDRFSSKSNGMLPVHKGDDSQEILDIILSKDDYVGDSDASNQVEFFSGSPPARTNNPIVRDAQFINQTVPLTTWHTIME
ncbi:uncharacterized protein LOC103723742 [Phoenix dactylifera]|uniref:Uncharacterized protein LOC103723742 n=1 Tax=Phoenix dactylifera TaxID=42345 RepID=A0A8B7D4I6_PHODC|nr:uncharacterized protein LOC103723742 [Phoenix dactylifera]